MIWVKTFARDLIGAHVDGVRTIAALPWLFALVIGWEFAQHVVEIHIGFFGSRAAGHAVADDASRMALGWVKMALVYGGGFVVIRHLVSRDGVRNVGPVLPALLRYLPYVAYSLILFALIFYAGSIVPEASVSAFRLTLGLVQMALEPALMLWVVSAATDGEIRGPLASIRRTGLLYCYALPLFFVGRLPVTVAHQALNLDAMGQPAGILWAMLAVDAVVVAVIVAVIPAISVRVVRRIDQMRQPERPWRPHTV